MKSPLTRRHFLRQAGVAAAGTALIATSRSSHSLAGPNDKVVVAIMGCNGRGMDHIGSYLTLPNVEIGYICDVDSRALERGVAAVAKQQTRKPKGVKDFRAALEDKSVDVLSIAAPNHWHAPAAIMACSAGKHVYVEKPCSHNPQESEWLVQAARQHDRVVQMGNQRRSWPWMIEAMQSLHGGDIGKVYFARTWYNNQRGSIGHGQVAPVPEWLDYALWQGPAPQKPYQDNLLHYNWHWRWHWGNGELGNNGIHALDIARWGLDVDYAKRVTCGGNRYHFDDDQETPDTYVTTYDFGDCGASWESHSCHPYGFEKAGFGIIFYAKGGTLVIANSNCKMLDLKGTTIREFKSPMKDADHFGNFVDCIRTNKRPNSEIEGGAKSTLLCHLGNIAYRTGRTVNCDPQTGKIIGDAEAAKLWRRDYQPGWEPKV